MIVGNTEMKMTVRAAKSLRSQRRNRIQEKNKAFNKVPYTHTF